MRKRLYRKLTIELQRRLPRALKPQVKNLALLTQALVFSEDCHLPKLALQLPIAGQRDSLIQRLARFLDNCRVDRQTHYLPLLAELFAHWPDREVNLRSAPDSIAARRRTVSSSGQACHVLRRQRVPRRRLATALSKAALGLASRREVRYFVPAR